MSQTTVETQATEEVEDRIVNLYKTDKWSRTVIQPILIAVVIASFFTAVGITIDVIITTRVFVRLWPILLLAGLEGVYTTIWLSHPDRRQLNHTYYRLAEFLLLTLILRLFTYAASNNYPQIELIAEYLRAPWLLFNDAYFIVSVLLTLFTWVRAIALSRTFQNIAIDQAEAYYYTLTDRDQDPGMKPAYSNRQQYVEALFQEWVLGGIILAVCTTIVAIDPPTFSLENASFPFAKYNLPTTMILTMVIYFIGGLLLLSQAKLGALNARWLHEGVVKKPDVERRWHRYTTYIIVFIALAALFLPIGSTFAIGTLLEALFIGIMAILSLLANIFIILLSLFFAPFTDQLALTPSEIEPTAIPATPVPTPTPAPVVPPDDTAQLLFSSAFWAVAIVGSIIALSFFLRGRGIKLNWPLVKQVGSGFWGWLRSLWLDVADYAADVRQVVRARLSQAEDDDEDGRKSPWRFIRLNALSPRDQIRYFYLSTVKRAGDRGVERGEDETPLEYMADLKEQWPGAEEEIEELTQAFLEARYSPEKIEENRLNPVKQQWKQLKASLRKRRQGK